MALEAGPSKESNRFLTVFAVCRTQLPCAAIYSTVVVLLLTMLGMQPRRGVVCACTTLGGMVGLLGSYAKLRAISTLGHREATAIAFVVGLASYVLSWKIVTGEVAARLSIVPIGILLLGAGLTRYIDVTDESPSNMLLMTILFYPILGWFVLLVLLLPLMLILSLALK